MGRDDHCGCLDEENHCFYIFGGYVKGSKENDLWKFNLEENIWEKIDGREEDKQEEE